MRCKIKRLHVCNSVILVFCLTIFLQNHKVILSVAKDLAAAIFAAVMKISLANATDHAAQNIARDPEHVLRTAQSDEGTRPRDARPAQDDFGCVLTYEWDITLGYKLNMVVRSPIAGLFDGT